MIGATAQFGLGSAAVGPRRFTRRGSLAMVGVAVAAVAVAVAFAVVGQPATAVRTDAFGGSVVIDDALGGPVVVDLADAVPTLRLDGVGAEVGASNEADVQAIGLQSGTLLLDNATGTINYVDPDQLVVAPNGTGVALPGPPAATTATAYPDGGQAYVLRQGPTATTISLVGRPTVAVAALLESGGGGGSGIPVSTATIGPLFTGVGAALVVDGRLWALVQSTPSSAHVVTVTPPAPGGRALVVTDRGHGVAPEAGSPPRTSPPRPGPLRPVSSGPGGAAGSTGPTGSDHTSRGQRARARPDHPSAGTGGSTGAGGAGQGAPGTPTVVAALGSGTVGGSDPAVVLASPRALTVLQGQAGGRTAPRLPVPTGRLGPVGAIVPVRDVPGRVLFAYHGSAGWFLLGVDLSTGRLVGPVAIRGTAATGLSEGSASAAGAGLISPVMDAGAVYALSAAASGARPVLVHIDPFDGRAAPLAVGGQSGAYPLVGPAEQPDWAAEQVLADGPRVVFNNPDSELAVVVFTDRGDRTVTVDKGSAVDIDPAAPPSALVVPGQAATSPPSGSTGSPAPSTGTQLVDAALACRATSQKPNVPQVAPPQPATHSVALSWTYPLIDKADCEPSSYTVTVTALGGAPQPSPATVAVTGQTSADVTGLLSDTTYSFVVTAYINDSSTAAPAVVATTTAEGPNAAAVVTTTANGTTGWDVSWQPCTGTCPSTEPVAAWQVSASACAGTFVGQLPTAEVAGDQDTTVVPFTADPDLIGTSLSFQVQPIGVDGLLGDPTTDGTCTEGWSAPLAGDITLDAAEPPAAGPTTTATLTVTPPPGLADAAVYGSEVTDFVYHVGNLTEGPITSSQASFQGLEPGTDYPTSVSVYPLGHPQAAVVVDGPDLNPTEPWPTDLALTATAENDSFLSGTLTATVTDAFGDLPPGLSVPLQAAGSILCGNEETAVPATDVTPGAGTDGQVTIPLSTASGDLGGACSVTLSLFETTTDVHGGPSPAVTATFSTGQPGAVAATWDPAPTSPYTSSSVVAVTATGDPGLVTGWKATVVAPAGCTVTAQSATADGTVRLDVSSCVATALSALRAAGQPSAQFDVTVEVSWTGPQGQESEDVAPPPQVLTVP